MDSLLLLGVEVMVIAVSVWVIVTESKTPDEIGRCLDTTPAPRKVRFAHLHQAGRPGERR